MSEIEISQKELPSYLQNKPNSSYKQKIDKFLKAYCEQDMTMQDLKILKLAYGLSEDFLDRNLQHASHQAYQLTDDSNLELIDSSNNQMYKSNFENPDQPDAGRSQYKDEM